MMSCDAACQVGYDVMMATKSIELTADVCVVEGVEDRKEGS